MDENWLRDHMEWEHHHTTRGDAFHVAVEVDKVEDLHLQAHVQATVDRALAYALEHVRLERVEEH